MNVLQSAEAFGLKTPSVVYELLAEGRLTGRKVRQGNTVRWEVDEASVQAEKERREQGAEPPNRYRPVFIRLPDEGMPYDPEERAALIRKLRDAAYAAQETG